LSSTVIIKCEVSTVTRWQQCGTRAWMSVDGYEFVDAALYINSPGNVLCP